MPLSSCERCSEKTCSYLSLASWYTAVNSATVGCDVVGRTGEASSLAKNCSAVRSMTSR